MANNASIQFNKSRSSASKASVKNSYQVNNLNENIIIFKYTISQQLG